MPQPITAALRLIVVPKTPKLKVRLEHLQRFVDSNPPLHNLHCLFPDVLRVMGQDYYISKTAAGIAVRDGAELIAEIYPAQA